MARYRMLQSDVRMDVEEELERLEGVRLSDVGPDAGFDWVAAKAWTWFGLGLLE